MTETKTRNTNIPISPQKVTSLQVLYIQVLCPEHLIKKEAAKGKAGPRTLARTKALPRVTAKSKVVTSTTIKINAVPREEKEAQGAECLGLQEAERQQKGDISVLVTFQFW